MLKNGYDNVINNKGLNNSSSQATSFKNKLTDGMETFGELFGDAVNGAVNYLKTPAPTYNDVDGTKTTKDKVLEKASEVLGKIPSFAPAYDNIEPSSQSHVVVEAVTQMFIGTSFIGKRQSEQVYNSDAAVKTNHSASDEKQSFSGYNGNYGTFLADPFAPRVKIK